MSEPDQRARDRDRDAAIEVVEAAWVDGQIVEADRDRRVEELLRAQTLADIYLLTHDLQRPPAPAGEPGAGEAAAAEPPAAEQPPQPPYGQPTVTVQESPAGPNITVSWPVAPRQRRPTIPLRVAGGRVRLRQLMLPLVIALIVGVAAVGGLVGVVRAIDGAMEGTGAVASGPADVLSEDGYADLLAAIEAQTGATEAFTATLYPDYAVVELPVDATSRRQAYWYWDGSQLLGTDSKGQASSDRIDLADVDAAVLLRVLDRVRTQVEEPTTSYVILGAPESDGASIWAYASNEYQESVYFAARIDGTVTRRSNAS